MKLINSLLCERVINAFDLQKMEMYKTRVWELLNIAYADIGGFMGATSPEHLITKTDQWKMVRRNGTIVAVAIYKSTHNHRKLIGIGHDGSKSGKREVVKLLIDDANLARAWSEVSGGMETLMLSLGHQSLLKPLTPLTHPDIQYL